MSQPISTDHTLLATKRDELIDRIKGYGACVVALSAGVDSAVVAKAAKLALGDRASAVTGRSPSLAAGELEQAISLAALIGIRHQIIETEEFSKAEYVANAPDRCYHCKTELYAQLEQWAAQIGTRIILNGANLDDQGDYRPGMQAAAERAIRSPLIEVGLNKTQVRALARHWGLPVWDKPATPCLSSRVAYGEAVTPQRLAMIDAAEQYLRSLGLREVRVRYHRGDLARLEVPLAAISSLCEPQTRDALTSRLKSLGFKFVTIDLEGFRSGSLNLLHQIKPLGS
jgi:uncharacterized protein